jgi:hypothetical protein
MSKIENHLFFKKTNILKEYFSKEQQRHLAASDKKSSDASQKNLIFSLCRDLPGPNFFLSVVNTLVYK